MGLDQLHHDLASSVKLLVLCSYKVLTTPESFANSIATVRIRTLCWPVVSILHVLVMRSHVLAMLGVILAQYCWL